MEGGIRPPATRSQRGRGLVGARAHALAATYFGPRERRPGGRTVSTMPGAGSAPIVFFGRGDNRGRLRGMIVRAGEGSIGCVTADGRVHHRDALADLDAAHARA